MNSAKWIGIAALLLASSAAFAQRSTQSTPSSTPPTRAPLPSAPRTVQGPSAAELMRRNGGSLLRASMSIQQDAAQAELRDVSFFYVPEPKPRTLAKHDLVTIIIREQSTSKSEGASDSSKEASLEAKLEEWISLNVKNFAVQGGAQGATPPSIKLGGKREHKGDASIDRSDSMSDRITAEVLDVKPNGTVVLQGRRNIRTDDETATIVISGTCRAEDVTGDNTILSHQLHDLAVTKATDGAVRDATRRGWFTKIVDGVSPF